MLRRVSSGYSTVIPPHCIRDVQKHKQLTVSVSQCEDDTLPGIKCPSVYSVFPHNKPCTPPSPKLLAAVLL